MSGINDFVVKFATVNGSGSASANGIFAKTLFRMGIPVSPKNIFPSNIQGLPTWYEVRVSEAGHLARRDGIDLMVAMNPQSYQDDLGELVPGGWLLYDSTLPRVWPRDDIKVLGIPIAELCARKWSDPRQRQLFKNMAYVGALTALLDIDLEVLRASISDQLKGKEKLVSANMEAVMLGRDYAARNFDCPLPIRVRPAAGHQGQDSGDLATPRRASAPSTPAPRCAPGTPSRRQPRWPRRSRPTPSACASPRTAAASTASSRPRTSWPPSASPSARAGTERAPSPPPPAPASR